MLFQKKIFVAIVVILFSTNSMGAHAGDQRSNKALVAAGLGLLTIAILADKGGNRHQKVYNRRGRGHRSPSRGRVCKNRYGERIPARYCELSKRRTGQHPLRHRYDEHCSHSVHRSHSRGGNLYSYRNTDYRRYIQR